MQEVQLNIQKCRRSDSTFCVSNFALHPPHACIHSEKFGNMGYQR